MASVFVGSRRYAASAASKAFSFLFHSRYIFAIFVNVFVCLPNCLIALRYTELILTTTVSRGGQYVARTTDVYYLENADTPLFLRPAHYRAVNMKVVSQ